MPLKTWLAPTLLALTLPLVAWAERSAGIAAIVGNQIITHAQVQHTEDRMLQWLDAHHQHHPSQAELERTALNQLIGEALQLQAAEDAGITVSKHDLQAAIKHVARLQGMTVEELKAHLASQHIPWQEAVEDVRHHVLIERVQAHALGASVHVPEAAIDRAMADQAATRTVHVMDYLLADSSLKERNRHVKALRQHLTHGTTTLPDRMQAFITTNDLGERALNDLPKVFEHAINQAKPGTRILGPLEAPNGWHVLYLTEPLPSAHADRERVKQYLWGKALAAKVPEWLDTLKAHTYVRINDA